MLTTFIVAQLVGILAMLVGVVAYRQTNEARMHLLIGVIVSLWAISNLLIEAYTGALMCMLAALRQWGVLWLETASFKDKRRAAHAFSLVATVFLVFTWQGWSSLLPYTSALGLAYASYHLTGINLRKSLALNEVIWGIHGLLFMSPLIVINALVNLWVLLTHMNKAPGYKSINSTNP